MIPRGYSRSCWVKMSLKRTKSEEKANKYGAKRDTPAGNCTLSDRKCKQVLCQVSSLSPRGPARFLCKYHANNTSLPSPGGLQLPCQVFLCKYHAKLSSSPRPHVPAGTSRQPRARRSRAGNMAQILLAMQAACQVILIKVYRWHEHCINANGVPS